MALNSVTTVATLTTVTTVTTVAVIYGGDHRTAPASLGQLNITLLIIEIYIFFTTFRRKKPPLQVARRPYRMKLHQRQNPPRKEHVNFLMTNNITVVSFKIKNALIF